MKLLALASSALVAVTLSGCGGGGTPVPTPAPLPPSPAPTPPAPTPPAPTPPAPTPPTPTPPTPTPPTPTPPTPTPPTPTPPTPTPPTPTPPTPPTPTPAPMPPTPTPSAPPTPAPMPPTPPAPTPTPAPMPPTPPAPTPTPPVAPDPALMTYRLPDHTAFNCITAADQPSTESQKGFFMFRWSSEDEAIKNYLNSDDLSDINPYYLLTELMTNLGTQPPASKAGGCHIPHCGVDGLGGCVLERIYIMYDPTPVQDVAPNGWGSYLSVDNGIPSNYGYWAFNWSGVANPLQCTQDSFSYGCNFYFEGGYPIGCQRKSPLLDTPVWYTTVGACPQYPYHAASTNPAKVDPSFVWHDKLNLSDPAVQQCNREMPGGDFCNFGQSTPFTAPSKSCTWKALKAGYLQIADVFNIPSNYDSYTAWCNDDATTETDYGSGLGIPTNITLFYNLSETEFPSLKTVTNQMWHGQASSFDPSTIDAEAVTVFQNWAKYAKIRIADMFKAMDKQAFAHYQQQGYTDPNGRSYENCLSLDSFQTPECTLGLERSSTDVELVV